MSSETKKNTSMGWDNSVRRSTMEMYHRELRQRVVHGYKLPTSYCVEKIKTPDVWSMQVEYTITAAIHANTESVTKII